MAYIPPPRKTPRSTTARLTRNVKHGGAIFLAGYPPPESVSRKQAKWLRDSGAIETGRG